MPVHRESQEFHKEEMEQLHKTTPEKAAERDAGTPVQSTEVASPSPEAVEHSGSFQQQTENESLDSEMNTSNLSEPSSGENSIKVLFYILPI